MNWKKLGILILSVHAAQGAAPNSLRKAPRLARRDTARRKAALRRGAAVEDLHLVLRDGDSGVEEGAFRVTLEIAAGPGSLRKAQRLARHGIARRKAALRSGAAVEDLHVVLRDGVHRVPRGGLHFSEQDSGVESAFRVTWSATNNSVVDGGRVLVAPFVQAKDFRSGVWAAAAPAELTNMSATLAARQLFWRGVRLNRTSVAAAALGLDAQTPWNAAITSSGYRTMSSAALAFGDPTSVELVNDHTWVQHRCTLASVRPLVAATRAAAAAPPARASSCDWGPVVSGASPGSTLGPKLRNVPNASECQRECCEMQSQGCRGMIFHPPASVPNASGAANCYLLNRDFKPNYVPQRNSVVAALGAAPPSPFAAEINVSAACWATARASGYGQLLYPDRFENVPIFADATDARADARAGGAGGQWWLDRRGKRIVVTLPGSARSSAEPPRASDFVWSKTATLLELRGVHDVSFENITLRHSTWNQANTEAGFVERYSNVFFAPRRARLVAPRAAVMVADAQRVAFEGPFFISFVCFYSFVDSSLLSLRSVPR